MHALVHTLAPAMHGRSSVQLTQRWVAGSQICLNTETPTLQSAVVMHSNAQIIERGPPSAASAIASSNAPPSANLSSGASLAASPGAGSTLSSDADESFAPSCASSCASACASSLETSGISAVGSLAESLLESCETGASVLEALGKAVESSPAPQPQTAQRAATAGPMPRNPR